MILRWKSQLEEIQLLWPKLYSIQMLRLKSNQGRQEFQWDDFKTAMRILAKWKRRTCYRYKSSSAASAKNSGPINSLGLNSLTERARQAFFSTQKFTPSMTLKRQKKTNFTFGWVSDRLTGVSLAQDVALKPMVNIATSRWNGLPSSLWIACSKMTRKFRLCRWMPARRSRLSTSANRTRWK